MVDARHLALGSETESVPACQGLDLGDDAHTLGPRELLQLLDDLAEPSEIPLEACSVTDCAGVESTGGADCGIPCGEVGAVHDGVEHFVDRGLDELRVSDERHFSPSFVGSPQRSNIGAKGRASKKTRTAEILPSRKRYHSAVGAVPAGVAVTRS